MDSIKEALDQILSGKPIEEVFAQNKRLRKENSDKGSKPAESSK